MVSNRTAEYIGQVLELILGQTRNRKYTVHVQQLLKKATIYDDRNWPSDCSRHTVTTMPFQTESIDAVALKQPVYLSSEQSAEAVA